jgi:hypothetical protein
VTQPSTAREALIVEALGEIARLVDRVEALAPVMNDAQRAVVQASDQLLHRVVAFEARMATITENAKNKTVEHIARRTDQLARQSLAQQTQAMTESARAICNAEIGTTLQRLASSVHTLAERVERAERPWLCWLTHAATAAVSACATTIALTVYLPIR